MPVDFLHNQKDFASLLRIVAEEIKVQPVLVEKDYWIMHCLYGPAAAGHGFRAERAHRSPKEPDHQPTSVPGLTILRHRASS
ncbi:hypothetical protein WGT02_23620 (plasmid) [Rhizobium sp. T1470]|uniref:hypothetical protein n=1 Tax=unclassified Rhizobium TaxID=2613769 RepID=UPI001CD77948|nr:hypothetical protein [Rhizobium sp. T1473]MCA0804476.1 hypothetical protein [Rhizobium sp. T1473]